MPSTATNAPKQPKPRGRVSAGCVVTRQRNGNTEVLLVHPKGATFRKPVFGIPKGLVEPEENFETAAVRETLEETGLHVRVLAPLGSIRQKSGKVVHAFWAQVLPESIRDIDERGRCTRADQHEVDVCRFYPLEQAEPLMIPEQRAFLDRLRELMCLASNPGARHSR